MSRKRERRKNESWKKQRGRAAALRKKGRGGRSRVIQFNVRARRHHLSQRTAGVLHKQKVRIDITKIFLIYTLNLLVFFALTKNNRSNSLLRKRYKPSSLCLSRLRFIARRRRAEEEEEEETSTKNLNNNSSSSNLCERKSLEKKKN